MRLFRIILVLLITSFSFIKFTIQLSANCLLLSEDLLSTNKTRFIIETDFEKFDIVNFSPKTYYKIKLAEFMNELNAIWTNQNNKVFKSDHFKSINFDFNWISKRQDYLYDFLVESFRLVKVIYNKSKRKFDLQFNPVIAHLLYHKTQIFPNDEITINDMKLTIFQFNLVRNFWRSLYDDIARINREIEMANIQLWKSEKNTNYFIENCQIMDNSKIRNITLFKKFFKQTLKDPQIRQTIASYDIIERVVFYQKLFLQLRDYHYVFSDEKTDDKSQNELGSIRLKDPNFKTSIIDLGINESIITVNTIKPHSFEIKLNVYDFSILRYSIFSVDPYENGYVMNKQKCKRKKHQIRKKDIKDMFFVILNLEKESLARENPDCLLFVENIDFKRKRNDFFVIWKEYSLKVPKWDYFMSDFSTEIKTEIFGDLFGFFLHFVYTFEAFIVDECTYHSSNIVNVLKAFDDYIAKIKLWSLVSSKLRDEFYQN